MRTAKKSPATKMKTKARPSASKAIAKAKPKAMAKAKAVSEPKWAAKRKTTAKATKKAAGAKGTKTKAQAKLRTKVAAAPKTTGRASAKAQIKTQSRAKMKPQPKAKSQAESKGQAKQPPRRDAVGRLNPKYARDLRALSRENHESGNDRAFFRTPRSGDDLAEELGEEAVGSMTSGEDQSDRLAEAEVEEERGGPFVKTRGGDEFARGTDRSNPRDATREPFPRT